MNNYEVTEAEKLTNSKRVKCQSTSVRVKKPSFINFEFKSSLFTEKNKSLIEKLISRNISQETSFSVEESKDKINRKIKSKPKKAVSIIKSTMPKSVNVSLIEQKSKGNIKKYDNKFSTKNILTNKNNSTIISKDKEKNSSIINCQVKPIYKKYLKISQKPNPNPQKKFHIQTIRNSIEKKKIVFTGLTKDINNNNNKNKTRNNPINQKQNQNSNLNSSVKSIFRRKKFENKAIGVEYKNKIIKNKNLRNSVDNKYNNLNVITVNTVNLKERKQYTVTNNNINLKTKNKNKANNVFSSPKYRNTIQYK